MRGKPAPELRAPRAFRGGFHTDASARDAYAGSRGPVRLRPSAVALPQDAHDIATLLRWCGSEGHPVVPRGAATGMPGGNVGRGVVLELGAPFRWIGPVDGARRTVRVGAGAVAADVEQAAARAGLSFPPLPSSAAWATLGGMIAANAAGARTFAAGATRAWVESVEGVLPDGRIVEVGSTALAGLPPVGSPAVDPGPDWPAVRKNSSGYALDAYASTGRPVDLVIGSEGTLAVVTAATLRLEPLPRATALAVVACADLPALLDWTAWCRDTGTRTCEMLGRRLLDMIGLENDPELADLGGGQEALLLIEVAGDEAQVAALTADLEARARTAGAPVRIARDAATSATLWGLRHRASPLIQEAAGRGLRSLQFIEDGVVPPPALGRYLQGLDALLREAETDAVVFGHAGDGHVHVNPLVDLERPDWRARVRTLLDDTVELIASLGGTLSGEHGDGRIRAPYLPRIWGASRVRRFQGLKRAFDPHGLLNPGVILADAAQDPLDGFAD